MEINTRLGCNDRTRKIRKGGESVYAYPSRDDYGNSVPQFPERNNDPVEERGGEALRKKRIVTRKRFFLLLDRTPSYVNIGYTSVVSNPHLSLIALRITMTYREIPSCSFRYQEIYTFYSFEMEMNIGDIVVLSIRFKHI